ncbi:MAG: YfhO family protein, partial [Solobacterium sp.]|nr:YfhO family protein [Solobacterium sp.]
LLMIGCEKIFKGESVLFYTVVYALTVLNSYYFAFIASILIFGFCIIRYLADRKGRKLLPLVAKFFFASLAGGLIGIGLVLPCVMNLMFTDRLSVSNELSLFFDKPYMERLFHGLLFTNTTQSDTIMGSSAVVFVFLAVLAVKAKEYPGEAAMTVLLTVSVFLVPVCSLFNAMNYPTHRWIFAQDFMYSWLVVLLFEKARSLNMVQKVLVCLLLAAFVLAEVKLTIVFFNKSALLIFAAMAGTAGLVVLGEKLPLKLYTAGMFLMLAVSCASMAMHFFGYSSYGELLMFIDAGKAWPQIGTAGGFDLLEGLETDGVRFDSNNTMIKRNSTGVLDISGYDFYNSYYNNDIDRFHNELGLNLYPWNYGYNGLNRRGSLEHLLGTKYYIQPDDSTERPPYGYGKKLSSAYEEVEKDVYALYESDYNDSYFTLFTDVVNREDYLQYTPVERELVLSQAVVLEDEASTLTPVMDGYRELGWHALPSTMGYCDEDNRIMDGIFTLELDEPYEDGDLYVYFRNMVPINPAVTDFSLFVKTEDTETAFGINGMNQALGVMMPKNHMYGGKEEFIMNLGHVDEPVEEVHVRFNEGGTYRYDQFCIYGREKKAQIGEAENLVHPASEIRWENNTLSASLDIPTDGYLFTAVPYSKGFACYIDGVKTEILKADTAFMAVPVEKGSHEIVFRYSTPWRIPGILASIMGILCVFLLKKCED